MKGTENGWTTSNESKIVIASKSNCLLVDFIILRIILFNGYCRWESNSLVEKNAGFNE